VNALANSIDLEFDEESGEYYIVWEPVIMGAGKTAGEALEDLREASHFGVETLIDQKLQKIEKED
jgi:predicted RNase H-like HicB family nuclease